MSQPDPLVNIPRLETVRDAYKAELQDTIEDYVSEMATFRRIKETNTDEDILYIITGIIMDELTIMHHYRKELL